MEWHLGIFTLMAVMAAIIGGGTGIRMMYVDGEYRKMIKSRRRLQLKSVKTKVDMKQRARNAQALADVQGKRNANRRGVLMDGFCIFSILIIGFWAAFGDIKNLSVSIVVVMMLFMMTMVPFYYHAQNVLKRPT